MATKSKKKPAQPAHTQTPWVVIDSNGFTVRATARNMNVAFCGLSSQITDDEALANARLIAAAPSLLAIARQVAMAGTSVPPNMRALAAEIVAEAVEGST